MKNLRHNYIVNMFDGAFFGLAIGFASFSTILPLFVSTLTTSAVLIGMVPAIHNMGWQLPQLLIARRVSKAERFKPMTLLFTTQERLPFLGLALVAWFLPQIGNSAALVLTFLLLIWQGLGAGFAANPWQNLISRIIPGEMRATFFGMQSAFANLLSSGGAVAAGYILASYNSSKGFSICFLSTVFFMIFSFFALAATREPALPAGAAAPLPESFWGNILSLLKRDRNFRWFLIVRMAGQFASMGAAFYTVYAVRYHGMTTVMAGFMTGVLLITQTVANPALGWVSDKWSRKGVLAVGAVATGLSGLLALLSPSLYFFIPVFILYGIGNTAYWTIGMAMTLEFGSDVDRPSYVGMANSLIAPATILAPFVGGWLADASGYGTTFGVSAFIALITAVVMMAFVRDPTRI